MKTNLLIFAGAAIAGYFLAETLVSYTPFTQAYTFGVNRSDATVAG